MNISKQLKAIRELKKISQKELARRAHVTQATISHIESGRDIRLKIFERVADALGWGINLSPLSQVEGGENVK